MRKVLGKFYLMLGDDVGVLVKDDETNRTDGAFAMGASAFLEVSVDRRIRTSFHSQAILRTHPV